MQKHLVKAVTISYEAARDLVRHDGFEHAGYLTFLGLLAFFPFLVVIVAAFGFIGQGQAGSQFIAMVIAHLPKEALAALLPRIREITSGPPQGLLTLAIFGALWTSSSAVEGIRSVLNRAYRVSAPPHFFLRRLVSMLQIIVFTALVMAVMLVLVLAPLALHGFEDLTGLEVPLHITRLLTHYFVYIGAVILFLVVAGMYYVLPNIQQSLWAVVPGALLVVVLWVLGAGAVTIYLAKISSVNVIYGSLSSFIASLIFFYVMNIIFIYGAEFNHVLLEALGKQVTLREKVVRIRR